MSKKGILACRGVLAVCLLGFLLEVKYFVLVCFVWCSGRVVGLDAPYGNMAVRRDGFFQGWVRREER